MRMSRARTSPQSCARRSRSSSFSAGASASFIEGWAQGGRFSERVPSIFARRREGPSLQGVRGRARRSRARATLPPTSLSHESCTSNRYACTSLPHRCIDEAHSCTHHAHTRASLARCCISRRYACTSFPHRCIHEAHSCTHPMGWAHPSRSYPREYRSLLHQQAICMHLFPSSVHPRGSFVHPSHGMGTRARQMRARMSERGAWMRRHRLRDDARWMRR
jgi:hypothetical protein